jgi:hypothetical protein
LLVSTWIADHVYQQIEISDALRHLILEKMPSVYVQYDGDHTYVYECEACGKIQNASISQSGGTAGTASAACVHTHTTQEILQQATCRDTGLIASVCEKCDQIVELKTMGKTTHSMADGWYADHENHWHECTVCHEKTDLAVHTYPADSDCCSVCEKEKYILGDMNGDSIVNSSDAIYLLRHTIMPTLYPIAQPVDVNGDGTVNSADAIYLLRHTIMPQLYPLVKK